MLHVTSALEDESMRRRLWIGLIVGGLSGFGLSSALQTPEAVAQKIRDEAQWEYKVGVFSYNPGEQLTDEQRAAFYERTLNEQARQGWEPVGTLLTRDAVQTVGGAVTTRDTTSFVAYRRRR
jgi:hypothetical protein